MQQLGDPQHSTSPNHLTRVLELCDFKTEVKMTVERVWKEGESGKKCGKTKYRVGVYLIKSNYSKNSQEATIPEKLSMTPKSVKELYAVDLTNAIYDQAAESNNKLPLQAHLAQLEILVKEIEDDTARDDPKHFLMAFTNGLFCVAFDKFFAGRYSPEDILYYQQNFGINPLRDANVRELKDDYCVMEYERWYDFPEDTILRKASIQIGCNVQSKINTGGELLSLQNRIVFRNTRTKREASVDCIHTAISTITEDGTGADEFDVAEEAVMRRRGVRLESPMTTPIEHVQSTEGNLDLKKTLDPVEHYISLNSYVSAIADFGIEQLITASYHSDSINPETLPFGFNAAMQRQVIGALGRIGEEQIDQLVAVAMVEIFKNVPRDWLVQRLPLLDETYELIRIVSKFPEMFGGITLTLPEVANMLKWRQ